jgi:hypothetical protein
MTTLPELDWKSTPHRKTSGVIRGDHSGKDGSLNRPAAERSAAGRRSSCISNNAGWHRCAAFHASICSTLKAAYPFMNGISRSDASPVVSSVSLLVTVAA